MHMHDSIICICWEEERGRGRRRGGEGKRAGGRGTERERGGRGRRERSNDVHSCTAKSPQICSQ